MVPDAPIITGITFVFTFYMRCISIVRSLYFRILSASFLITFLSPEIYYYYYHHHYHHQLKYLLFYSIHGVGLYDDVNSLNYID